ncbi:MAG: histidine phosphatase family protein [Lentisphaerae bacterium]|nr:histidine phosphatase family protein [Lentisphaerota bacterium]
MKTLILVRHAKSSWKEPAQPDRERPLNARGRRDAPEMGRRLAQRGLNPDRLISSPAVRAWVTAQTVAGALGYNPAAIHAEEALYGAGLDTWLDMLRRLNDAWSTVMLFGHNPGLTEAARRLSGRPIENVPTCGVVMLRYETAHWRDAAGGLQPTEVILDTPKRPAPYSR